MMSEQKHISAPIPEGKNIAPGIVVRRAMLWEAEKIHRLVRDSMETYCTLAGINDDRLESNTETIADIRRALLDGIVLVAEDNSSQIVGTARLFFRKVHCFTEASYFQTLATPDDTVVLYFTRFAVKQSMRGNGIGSLLLLASEDIAKSEGIPAIFLYTALSNETVSSFYLNRGFEIDSIDLTRKYPRGLFIKPLT